MKMTDQSGAGKGREERKEEQATWAIALTLTGLLRSYSDTHDFEGRIDLSVLALYFSHIKLSSSTTSLIERATTDEPRKWVGVLTSEEYYHPMVIILSLGVYATQIDTLVDSIKTSLTGIEKLGLIRELGVSDRLETEGYTDLSKVEGLVTELEALGAAGRSALPGPSQLSLDNIKTVARTCGNKIPSEKWDTLFKSVCQKLDLAIDSDTVSPQTLELGVLMSHLTPCLPKDRIIHVHCRSDIWFLVVLAHEIMGLDISVVGVLDTPVKFGQGPDRLVIQASEKHEIGLL